MRNVFSVPKVKIKTPKKRVWQHKPLADCKATPNKKSKKQQLYTNLVSKIKSDRKKAHPFYTSIPWRMLRGQILCKHDCCVKCGSKSYLQVDHIKPRSKYPHLELEITNLQVLCQSCNMDKSDKDS